MIKSTNLIPINDLNRMHMGMKNDLLKIFDDFINKGQLILGDSLQEFENSFSKYCGTEYCIGVGNGTDALEIALRAMGCQEEDKVITVANAGFYSSVAILNIGAKPVYVDIDPTSLLIDINQIESKITPKTKGIIVTHLYGRMVDVSSLKESLSKHNLFIIEDCAQAHGAEINGKKAGSLGDASCFSFYPTKNLGALGDAGAILTNDPSLKKKIIALRQYGWNAKYHVELPGGRNSRLDPLQASILMHKLKFLDESNQKRKKIADLYSSSFLELNLKTFTKIDLSYVAHLFVVQHPKREMIRKLLAERNIQTDIHYPIPDYQQQIIKDQFSSQVLPITETSAKEIFTLPCHPDLTQQEMNYVIKSVKECLSII